MVKGKPILGHVQQWP